MRSQVLDQPNFEHEEEVQNAKILLIRNRIKNGYKALSLFLLVTLTIALYRYFLTKDIVTDGHIYQSIQHFSYSNASLIPFSIAQSDEGSLAVTKQQLGKMAWTVLHMSTATFPDNFDLSLASKFHTFLILFAKLYPCKPCGDLFLKHLEHMKPFDGTKRQEIMVYLCKLHNKISQDIGKDPNDCSKVKEEWSLYGDQQ